MSGSSDQWQPPLALIKVLLACADMNQAMSLCASMPLCALCAGAHEALSRLIPGAVEVAPLAGSAASAPCFLRFILLREAAVRELNPFMASNSNCWSRRPGPAHQWLGVGWCPRGPQGTFSRRGCWHRSSRLRVRKCSCVAVWRSPLLGSVAGCSQEQWLSQAGTACAASPSVGSLNSLKLRQVTEAFCGQRYL
jgi:hypothetical protein